jgi:hypothetical protein
VIFPEEVILYVKPFPTNSRVNNEGLIPEMVAAAEALKRRVPLLCVNVALVKAALWSISSIADVEMKVVPFSVKFPPIVIFPEPAENVPPVKPALPIILMLPVPPVNTPPEKVEFPPTVISPVPATNVPEAMLTLLYSFLRGHY